jgi:hypothetical protein
VVFVTAVGSLDGRRARGPWSLAKFKSCAAKARLVEPDFSTRPVVLATQGI